jgi:hypothetical protein
MKLLSGISLSGTYTIQIGPNILDQFGDAVDTNQNAGLAVLRDQGQNSPTTTVQYSSTGLPQAIPAPTGSVPGTMASSILVPDNFVVQGDTTTSGISGLRVQINLTYPFDPDLSATLYYDMGQPSQVAVPLFSGVGNGIKTADFTNTVFDDNAATPIQNGSAPFFAIFNPQMPLSAFAGLNAAGTWTLVIQNATTANGGTGGHWLADALVAELPEAVADLGPRRTGQRRHQRQFPHLHHRPDRGALERSVDGCRTGGDHRRLRPDQRDRGRPIRSLG